MSNTPSESVMRLVCILTNGAPLSTLGRIRPNVDYPEKNEMPKLTGESLSCNEIASKTSA